jgi:nicotinamidase-related amidase
MSMSSEPTALIAVDVQGDFLPGGALAVRNGNEVIAPLVELAKSADVVVATRDFHPAGHCSFVAQGGPWPQHCVIGTTGALITPAIDAIAQLIVSKGMDANVEAYSGFDGTGLADILRGLEIGSVVIGGLATDYCVRATALAALREGFMTTVIADAILAVDVNPGDGERALEEMRQAGAVVKNAGALR